MRRPIWIILVATCLLVGLAGAGWAEEAAGTAAVAEPAPADGAAPAGAPADWEARLDRWFGAHVLAPIAKVFFWDVVFWDDPRTGVTIPIAVLWLVVGAVFFTIRMSFINLRAFRHAIDVTRGRYDNPADPGEVTHFQALSAALSATVGLGNIAGVAIAISLGGPGATFWMIVAGLLGMSAKFAECTLGQKYRHTRGDGRIMGGAMYYLSQGLGELRLASLGKVLAVLFAVLCIGGSLAGGNAFQVRQSLDAVAETVPFLADEGWVYGAVMTVLVGVVIIGGIVRIATTASRIVPAMCILYVAACLFIILKNAGEVPDALGAIVREAFSPDAMYGGFIGVLILGFKRAAFSNEAGVGSAAIAHSAAKTEYPVREGIVALLEPFIDTVVVCTMTALVIVITGAYNDPSYAHLVAGNNGAALTSNAMGAEIGWFPYILSVAVALFAFSTMISWSYYGERCWTWLFGDRSSMIYRVLFLWFVFLGSILSARNLLEFGDLMILGMAFPNIVGVLLLSGKVKRDLDEYMGKLRRGELPRYK
jgi:alanine or glycine:cation symporter, AGCS family